MNRRFTQLAFSLSLLTTALTVNASEYPGGCIASGYNFNNSYLFLNESGNQTFFMIQNKSANKVELQRVQTKDAFMTPALTIALDPGQWAAFSSDIPHLPIECHTLDGENTAPVDCQQYIDLCQYPHVKFALSNMGNYWVSTNKSKADVIKDSVAKGIYLKW